MKPCSTPVITLCVIELVPFIVTNIFLFVRELLIILTMLTGVLILPDGIEGFLHIQEN